MGISPVIKAQPLEIAALQAFGLTTGETPTHLTYF